MRIVFQTDQGTRFSAELTDESKLVDIKPIDGTPPPPPQASGQQPSTPPQSQGDLQGGEEPPISREDRVFIERLQAVLVNNRARKQLRNKQKGSLDLKALVRTQTDSQSVFKQHNRKDSHRNYSVLLLVDQSGSMTGEKAVLAQELTNSISHSLDKVGGVEVAVLGFSNNRIVEHKRFDNTGYNSIGCINKLTARGSSHECRICNQIERISRNSGGNSDLIAMEYALDYLTRNHAPNSRPIFIMLSDGAPCESRRDIEIVDADLKATTFESRIVPNLSVSTRNIGQMHKIVNRYTQVESFGLGMFEGGQQVPKHKVVQDLGETKRVLLEYLRATIS